jgi:hypothetical protein
MLRIHFEEPGAVAMRAGAIAVLAMWTVAVWAVGSVAARAADASAGGPAAGYGPDAYSPRIEPLIVWDYQPGVIVRSYWWSPWQNRHYFPKTGKRPKVGRLEHVTARKSSVAQDYYRSWSVSSVFAPGLPPPPMQPYMQPYLQPYSQPYIQSGPQGYGQPYGPDQAPSLAQPR